NQFRKIKPGDNTVSCAQLMIGEIMANIGAEPDDSTDSNTWSPENRNLGNFLANNRRFFAHGQLCEKVAFIIAVKCTADEVARLLFGQEPATEKDHHDRTSQCRCQTIRCDFENSESVQATILRHGIDNQVCRCPDQSRCAAQNTDETQRNEQFLGRKAG